MKKRISLFEKHPELAKEWHPTKNGELTPHDVSFGSKTAVWWVCSKGHEWKSSICNRTGLSRNCPYCSGRRVLSGLNDLTTVNPTLASEWHPTKNGTLTPEKVAPGSGKMVWWLGKCGHEWQSIVSNRLKGQGCPYCSGNRILPGFNDLATLCPSILTEWHTERNAPLQPSEIGRGSSLKVWWRCGNGHEWQASVHSRVRGNGCPYCDGRKVIVGVNDLATLYPEVAAEWHPTKNGTLAASDVTFGSNEKVWWLGKCGHEWQAVIFNRSSQGRGCPYCAGQKVLSGFNDLATLYPSIAKEWHPSKNNGLLPSDFTGKSGIKVWWQCEKGHEWKTTIYQRTGKGSICPHCSNNLKKSFPEQAVAFYIKKAFPDTLINVKKEDLPWLENKELDIYIPSLMFAIEYDGGIWHKNIDKDLEKDKLCLDNNTKILRIRERKTPPIPSPLVFNLKNETDFELVSVIRKVITYLDPSIDIEIDLGKDRSSIYSLFVTAEIEKSLSIKNPELAAQWHPTKNGLLQPVHVSFQSNKKVWWQCSKGHEWQEKVSNRAHGKGCPYCSGHRVLAGFNDLATTHPTLATQWCSEKNGELTPQNISFGSIKNVWWKCEEGHTWEATPNSRTNRNCGCPYCSGRRVLPGFNDLATKRPLLVAEWHPTKNEGLTPQDLTFRSNKKVWWLCQNCGHEWQAPPQNRSIGRNCPVCAKERRKRK